MYLSSLQISSMIIESTTGETRDQRPRLGGRGQDEGATDDQGRFYRCGLSLQVISDRVFFTGMEYSCFFGVFRAFR